MKSRRWFAVLLLGVVLGCSTVVGGETKTSRVGVMKFETGDGVAASLGKFLSETLTARLVEGREYTVVDWEEIDRVLGMEAKSQPVVSAEDARRMAMSKAGLEKLFLGRVDKLGSKYHVTVKLIGLDLRVERVEQSVADNEEEMPQAVQQVAAKLLVDNSDEAKAKRAVEKARLEAEAKKQEEERAAEKARVEADAKQKEEARLGEEKKRREAEEAARRKNNPAFAMKERPWTNSLGMPFVPVPGTEVLFCIWHTRVKDFEAFVQASGYNATAGMYSMTKGDWKQRGHTWRNPGFDQGPDHPVCGVSWQDAKAFCRWLTENERSKGKLSGEHFYRLPTDAEWSTAVGLPEEGGGTPWEKDERIKDVYPWGTQWPPPAGAGNYAGKEDGGWPDRMAVIAGYRDGYARTSPVGSFRGNRLGLYDMGGNLWQWCEDRAHDDSTHYVSRGGSWCPDDPRCLLSSFRHIDLPTDRYDYNGFRCVVVGVKAR